MKRTAARVMNSPANHWNRLSDDELLSTVFTTTDPEALDGLVPEPIIDESARVELAYDFRNTKHSMIACAHCGTHPNHKAGYVIRVGDARFLCGHQCGDQIYGADFERMHSEFEAAKSKSITLKRMRNLQAQLPAVNAFCTEVARSPVPRAYEQMRKSIPPRLKGEFEMAFFNRNGQLMARIEERDYEVEKREREQYEKDVAYYKRLKPAERRELAYAPIKPITPKMHWVLKPFGVIYTPTLFGPYAYKHQTFVDLMRQLQKLEALGVAVDFMQNPRRRGSQQNFQEALKQTNIMLDRLIEELEKLNEWEEFFSPRNLQLVAEWATARADIDGEFRAEPNALTHTTENGVRVFRKLPGYSLVDLSVLRGFKNAINTVE